MDRECFSKLSLCDEKSTLQLSGHEESDCFVGTKHCDGLKWCGHNVIFAQCPECQIDQIQTSAGERR